MRLHLLGTGGYHPSRSRHTACFMIPEAGLIFDAGTGIFRTRSRLELPTLDIFLSHCHLDHIVGLTYLLDVMYGQSLERVTVHGETAKLRAIQDHLFAEPIFPVLPAVEWRALVDPVRLADGGTVNWFPVDHPGGAIGFRADWPGRSFAYVTDTTAAIDAAYIERIRGVDVLIHECYFPDGWEERARLTGHSCTSPVASVAKAAGVGRLILVHVNPLAENDDPIGIAAAQAIFANTELGHDELIVEF
jgi:ribonuclease Z